MKIQSFSMDGTSIQMSTEYHNYLNSIGNVFQNIAPLDDEVIRKVRESWVGNNMNRPSNSKGLKIMNSPDGKGVFSDEPKYIKFLRTVQPRLRHNLPSSQTDEFGNLQYPYVDTEWYELNTVAGYLMNPVGTPSFSSFKADVKLTEFEERVLTTVAQLTFCELGETSLTINKNAKQGGGEFHSSLHTYMDGSIENIGKAENLDKIIKNSDKLLSVIISHDWLSLFELSGCVPIVNVTNRLQVDGFKWIEEDGKKILVPKPRPVTSISGQVTTADKLVPQFPGFQTNRVRLAYAYPQMLNAIMNTIFGAYRAAYYKNFPILWHHTSPDSVAQKFVNHPFLLCSDFSLFDQNCASNWIRKALDQMQLVPKEFIESCKVLTACPMVIKNDTLGGEGDILVNQFGYANGIPSGIAYVSDMGKIIGVFLAFLIATKAGLTCSENADETEVRRSVIRFMKGQNNKVILANQGDDCMFGLNSAESWFKMKEAVKNDRIQELMSTDFDPFNSFLGNIYSVDQSTKKIRHFPKLSSAFVKFMLPERGYMGKNFRTLACAGWIDRPHVYARHPKAEHFFKIVTSTWQEIFGFDINAQAVADYKNLPMKEQIQPQNLAEMIFRDNPDAIHYKIDGNDVRQEMKDLFYLSLSVHETNQFRENLFKNFEIIPQLDYVHDLIVNNQ
jgi:hypothetical protein